MPLNSPNNLANIQFWDVQNPPPKKNVWNLNAKSVPIMELPDFGRPVFRRLLYVSVWRRSYTWSDFLSISESFISPREKFRIFSDISLEQSIKVRR